jgi:hypothetical protein
MFQRLANEEIRKIQDDLEEIAQVSSNQSASSDARKQFCAKLKKKRRLTEEEQAKWREYGCDYIV